ncbi:uncharacterized protein LOC110019764 isoform X2 [Phalaenopsis equestris]|uniref:uncharacterized protein LOC110019764 isoform X2 n=1 Tax=Phalaenopsis equestris TaxID=78828 RepID=UPI0009E32C13|nr:uncharacterized protein LOC110019764 isoform X2 [Phalaenopsis equestris]
MVLRLGIRLSLPAPHSAGLVWLRRGQCMPVTYFSTGFIGDKPLLVRDFIRAVLYDTKYGYFSKLSGPVGVLDKAIRFGQIQGRDAYLQYLDKIYKQHDVAWFTPVELFKPWYAHAIAEAILRTTNLSIPLKIYEIGGGSGTCAKCILDYMLLNAPERVYNNLTYISVEISPSLAKRQLETVGEVSSHLNRYRVENRDALDRSGWHVDPNPCWVIMLEVLDNLPHDLVYSPDQVSPWTEAWIEKAEDSLQISETFKPLQDTLIAQCINIIGLDKERNIQPSRFFSAARKIWSKAFPKPHKAWMPTGCLQLLEVLHWALPKMSLVASDFNYLPDVRIMGDRAPLVSTKVWKALFRQCSMLLCFVAKNLHLNCSQKKGSQLIIQVTWMQRATLISSSQLIFGFWRELITTALDGQVRRTPDHLNL